MAGATVDDALPEAWIEKAELTARHEVPATFSEPVTWPDHLDGETIATISEVRRMTFPFFGLAP
jgi:hypothetical protein